MRLDVVTIFPEYLEPLRHALLGKAIEEGILSVGVHDLRDWATDRHRSVDDTPFGGGPGMVMKPEVWGPALDDVAAGRVAGELSSASPHVDKPRHDDVAGVEKQAYGEREDAELPLLLVPTPTGRPFTQADARAWSTEEHIVFACGRYEGIDQRVIEDAANRYRVREVSIGDYVLIGGEVAVLVIAEAVVRLIPGVLGNQASHQEDSFSDGLLEGPSYTKPRVWRGLEVPEVLTGGNHQAIDLWRREQSLKKTKAVRPELLETVELSDTDLRLLNERDVHTEINVLLSTAEWGQIAKKLPKKARRKGFDVSEILAETVDLTCEPDNVLVTQYQSENDGAALDPVYRVIVNGRSALPHREITKAVLAAFPEKTYWYGSSYDGHAEGGVTAVCAWQHPNP
ncbi:tRNA (guanine-N(1)-)-methyltransferase [Corynebacterium guangdongense]|uniref:tRNA (guanine-N(1)-)-methyltransferase n=1 Tax=Corynebacterium guangdongense TaxID=1783348 RepID=A0ABU1ZXG8_9CORY|nr:tRNA (guanine37-N1)-methyltransferase [Corynebacterium guangdongense]WJZ18191.1 tRNA (guanine-N(1)-)-methyltransferase [Corynebacterium guangdongense]